MDDRQLIADLLSALEYHTEQTRPIEFSKVAIQAAREYLQKPAQQEPVAVVSGYYGGQCVILPIDPARIYNSNTPLYTSPPPCPTCEALSRTVMLDQTSHDAQRQWVGLTDEEIDKTHETRVWDARRSYARAIEAKLKEKNT
jgi:imidazole glycerol phosphate synthase subunit HisF